MCLQEGIQEGFFCSTVCFCSFSNASDLKEAPFSLPEGIKDPSKGKFEWFVLAQLNYSVQTD